MDQQSREASCRVTAAGFRQFIALTEIPETDKKDMADRIRETYAQGKAWGYGCHQQDVV
ncbi:GapR family DNA-binding domain-containing protein [Paracoccus methylarcula]|uniref:GapR family DNA-binding domain-containing protein n=1 Tax=Paracoccus methylarcula TaxID=72022 RepID=UPI0014765366|nr:hypothetical protein [Paracoccus methylarcula]